MADFRRVSFSGDNLALTDITRQHVGVELSVRAYFVLNASYSNARFLGYKLDEIREEMEELLGEHDLSTVANLLAAVEAAFRIDYLQRCYAKKRDHLSRELREIYKRVGPRASLEDEILPAWKKLTSVQPQLISDLKGAFKYRHWLAHGRYWVPKLGQKYDYHGIYILAETVFDNFPLEGL